MHCSQEERLALTWPFLVDLEGCDVSGHESTMSQKRAKRGHWRFELPIDIVHVV